MPLECEGQRARRAKPRHRVRDHGLALRDGSDARFLHEPGSTTGVVLDQRAERHELSVEGDPPAPMGFRYQTAVDALIELHRLVLPDTLSVPPDLTHHIPPYDLDALMIEVELLPDWYLPMMQAPLAPGKRDVYVALWREALLAQKVLRGKTRGYRHHPQLRRFSPLADPPAALATYLAEVHAEATRRGYKFNAERIGRRRFSGKITETHGQLLYE